MLGQSAAPDPWGIRVSTSQKGGHYYDLDVVNIYMKGALGSWNSAPEKNRCPIEKVKEVKNMHWP